MDEVNQVEFRRPNASLWHSEPDRDVVEVFIDRRSLLDIVERSTQGRAGGRWLPAEWLFRQGHRFWLGEPASSPDLVHADGVSVLRCVDGLAECGGVSAHIELEGTYVTWKDLREVPTGKAINVGPFKFRRNQYETALEKASDPYRNHSR